MAGIVAASLLDTASAVEPSPAAKAKGSTKHAQKQHALHRQLTKLDLYNQDVDPTSMTSTAEEDPRCPVGSIPHNMPGFDDICAWRPSPATNWGQGEALCQQEGGHMSSFKNDQELFFIQSIMGFQGESYWVGLSKLDNANSKDAWFWSDGANPAYAKTVWIPGQPDNANGNEDCAQLNFGRGKALLNDIVCTAEQRYLCIKKVSGPKVFGGKEAGGEGEGEEGQDVVVVTEE